MTPEDEQCRDVYAHYGVAAYFAQCLEKSLTNFLLLHARATNTKLSLTEMDVFEQKLHKKTLGQLLKEAGAMLMHNPSSEQLVADALKKRNFLMHHYFWERAREFMTPEGRSQMISELEELQDLFQSADFFATALCKAAAQAAGIPWGYFEAEFDRMLKEVQDPETPASPGATPTN